MSKQRKINSAVDPNSKLALFLIADLLYIIPCGGMSVFTRWIKMHPAKTSQISLLTDHHKNANPGSPSFTIPNSQGPGAQPGTAHDIGGAIASEEFRPARPRNHDQNTSRARARTLIRPVTEHKPQQPRQDPLRRLHDSPRARHN